jgi:hypothetical protein
MQLLSRSADELRHGLFELMVEGDGPQLRVSWKRVELTVKEDAPEWSAAATLHFALATPGKA